MFLNLFNAVVRKKQRVLYIFRFIWFLELLILFFSLKSVILNTPDYAFFYPIAVLSGKLALVFFTIVLTPGIFKRFGVRNRVLGLLLIFRRQFGITMFLFAALHGLTVSVMPKIVNNALFRFSVFELYGLSALILLLLLFLTSNDFSQNRLGKSWYLLHRLVYLIMWLILIHVALQRLSYWSVLASILVVAEMAGIIYSNLKKYINASIQSSADNSVIVRSPLNKGQR